MLGIFSFLGGKWIILMVKMVVSFYVGRIVYCCVFCDVFWKFSDDRKIGKNLFFGGYFLCLFILFVENS